MNDEKKKDRFWKSFLKAVETEPRDIKEIRGSTGLRYPIIACGVDENRRRLVIISGESDSRSAAISHADIQASVPGMKVIVARPVATNLGQLADIITSIIGTKNIGPKEWKWLSEQGEDIKDAANQFGEDLKKRFEDYAVLNFDIASLNWSSVLKNIIDQAFLVKASLVVTRSEKDANGKIIDKHMPKLDLSPLIDYDPTRRDRDLGICPIPLYNFKEDQIDPFHTGTNLDDVREALRLQGIFQYFFPPPDHLALGLIDQKANRTASVEEQIKIVPSIGHPFGRQEIIQKEISTLDIVDALKERGLVVEGETGFEISPEGKNIRASVKFKPREGFLKKLSNVVSVKFDLSIKDFLK